MAADQFEKWAWKGGAWLMGRDVASSNDIGAPEPDSAHWHIEQKSASCLGTIETIRR
jgi:hypothetical protein